MKKVILAVLLTAFALFLILPSLSWAQEDLYKAKCAGCHGADGKATAAGKKMGSPEFSSPTVQKASNADLVLLTAFALFLILPSLSWAQEDLYKAKC